MDLATIFTVLDITQAERWHAGAITSLISTVVDLLEKANNRRQFVEALDAGAPLIHGILQLFADDAEDLYGIRAKQADAKRIAIQDAIATAVRQMRTVASEYATPGGNLMTKLSTIEDRTRETLNRAGLPDNSEKMPTPGMTPFTELIVSQFEQTLVQAEAEANKYQAVIEEQQAFEQLIVSYGQMLRQTAATLDIVRATLDKPVDIHAQARELISFAFAVKRDWEALQAARIAAAGS